MPHSGGGGSHGGGHHGGSHHSGSGGSSRRVSNSYFSGSHRYVYYYHGRPHVYYSTSPDGNPRLTGLFFLAFGLFWTFFSSVMFFAMSTFSSGGPLPLDYDTDIVIVDDIGVVEDYDALEEAFEEFQEKTGITFALVAVTPYTAEFGQDCETQSYNAYVRRWDDESHWLIYYVGSETDRSDNWEFNLMCGDSCPRILSYNQEDKFTENFYKYLIRDMSFDDAVLKAMDGLEPSLGAGLFYRDNVEVNGEPSGGERVDLFFVLFIGVFILIGLIMLIAGVVGTLFPKKEAIARSKAVKTEDPTVELREGKCRYCEGIYFIGTVTDCPHCGAPLPLSTEAMWADQQGQNLNM